MSLRVPPHDRQAWSTPMPGSEGLARDTQHVARALWTHNRRVSPDKGAQEQGARSVSQG